VADIDTGIRLTILAMGIALARFKEWEMYLDLDYHSMNDYIEALCDQIQIDRSTPHLWLLIGEAYFKYRKELEKIKFTDEDGPTKLRYVDKALQIHEKRDVFRNLKEMSYRGFKGFAKGNEAP
jgi:hypothetical protein